MIYLDNAATTFPKPRCVSREIAKCIEQYGGNAGRSGHFLSVKAAEKIYDCRQAVALLFKCDKPENVVFTLNTTYALNMAIQAFVVPGSHVLISNMEHNSVYRPIYKLSEENKISYSVFNTLQSEKAILKELENKRQPNTKMLIMTQSSNIIGCVFPIKSIGEFCKKHDITFIVDAAQSAGIEETNMSECNISALCAPAHKGLYGPQGLGFVIFGDEKPERGFIFGGNGINSLSPQMGTDLPESFEAGTMPTPAIAGLCASINWINSIGIKNIQRYEVALAKKMKDNLSMIRGSMIFGPTVPQSGIVLYKNKKISVNELVYQLDKMHICTRGGFHCAPLAHAAIGSGDDGALRISIGYFNNEKEIDAVSSVISKICK